MLFRTEITKQNYPFKISYTDTLMMVGSCFVENIGQILKDSAFDVVLNPCGIVFNPNSICTTFNHILEDTQYTKANLSYAQELWFSFDHHGRFSSTQANEVLNMLQVETDAAYHKLQQATVIFITLGTSMAYYHKETQKIVANCHKLPASCFQKIFIDKETILQNLGSVILKLQQLNPEINIVFSVSPVRYFSDGLIENQRSKSNLILSVHEICKRYTHCFYFPSYEIMNDDLRDYRYYTADLCHINELGINYIWDYFKQVFFDEETSNLQKQVRQLNQDMRHHPLHSDTQAYQEFKKSIEDRRNLLMKTILTKRKK